MIPIKVTDTVRLNPLFSRRTERDLRLTVLAVEDGAITAQFQHNDKIVKLAAQALVLAD